MKGQGPIAIKCGGKWPARIGTLTGAESVAMAFCFGCCSRLRITPTSLGASWKFNRCLGGESTYLFPASFMAFSLPLLTIAIPININNAPDESRSES